MPRWAFITMITVVLVLAGLASFSVVTVRMSFPHTDGSVQVAPLGRPVTVLRDASGIPRIYADTPEDLFAAQGYVDAQDRFFEMDVRRHITSGRLSELFGESQVDTDIYLRTLGWRRVAEEELGLVSQRTRRYLDSYAAGVNTYIDTHSANELSLEYAVLGLQGLSYIPRPWTAVDSLAWLKAMAWDTGSNMWQELEVGVLSETIGPERARSIQPFYDPEVFRPIVGHGAVRGGAFDPEATPGAHRPAVRTELGPDALAALEAVAGGGRELSEWMGRPGQSGGSNSWVISGEQTVSGKPILVNDPHLTTSIPGIFTQVGLHCRTVSADCPFNVTGFSFSGMPGVIIGHNADISWGLTTPYVDTQDLVIEQIRDGRVRRGEDWVPISARTEEIRVAGAEPRSVTIRQTSHGPILSDVDPSAKRHLGADPGADRVETAVALKWAALAPSRSIEAIFALNVATNFDEFRAAAELLEAPSQNLLYADTAGNIGYQLPGAIPIRKSGDGLRPVPGWDPAYDWEGMIPFAELPYALNPPEGYLVAANQQVIAGYPRPLGHNYSMGWRSQQIIHEINLRGEPFTVETTQVIFADSKVRYADLIVPALLAITPEEEWVADGQRVLADWDHTSPPDSAGAFYFHLVMKHVVQLTFDDEIPEDLRTGASDRWYAVVAELLREPNNEWWDDKSTSSIENRDSILARALTNARRDATRIRSEKPSGWDWGHSHRLKLKHQTLGSSGIGPVEAIFNRGDYPVGGGTAVVLAWSFHDREGFGVTNGPVMRMIVDLDDLDNSRWVNLSGQSGHAYHPNYADQLPLIARNELLPWAYTRQRVEAATTQRLELLPGR